MNNYNDFFESLSRMAEEYQKLIAPIRDQTQLPERWHEISSPILRIAETNKEILEGITFFDTEIAKRLEAITAPYQTYFDTISSVGRIMDTAFGAFVKPEFYVPNISNALLAITDTTSSVLRVNNWQVELSSLVDIDTSIFVGIDNPFKHLAEIEQAVAGLVQVQNLRSQMTSITAQIASLFQVGMNDEWKSVIIPDNLLDSLNSFALKQYVHIQKNRDPKEVAWRLGLVEVASKYVDNQILFGTEIAIDFDDIIPTIEAEYPDLSEFPVFFSSAKRDGEDVSEKFDESTYNIISEKAKLIYQKAKSINDFCKARGIPSLFSESRLINWAFELGRSFCRDTNSLAIVTDTLFAMFIREEIIDLIGYQSCFDTIGVEHKIKSQ